MTRLFITIFLGPFGVHKFMEKKVGLGFLYLFTGGLLGIGWIIDIIKAIISLSSNPSAKDGKSVNAMSEKATSNMQNKNPYTQGLSTAAKNREYVDFNNQNTDTTNGGYSMSLKDIFSISKIKAENEELRSTNAKLLSQIDSLGVTEYYQTKEKMDNLVSEANDKLSTLNNEIAENNSTIDATRSEITRLYEQNAKLAKQVSTQERKISRCKELYKSVDYAINNFCKRQTIRLMLK